MGSVNTESEVLVSVNILYSVGRFIDSAIKNVISTNRVTLRSYLISAGNEINI